MNEFKSKKYLKDIGSSYIIKHIFSFLGAKQQLNFIIYNKELQKILGVGIIGYKKVSGKYITGQRNEKGKEYNLDTNKLIVEGIYLDGKRNGAWKEYNLDTNKLIFEGKYLNGKRNGTGKEYYNNGLVKFKGEYVNGKRWNVKGYNPNGDEEFEIIDRKGLIKEYSEIGQLEFEGEILNGERNGEEKEYYYNGYKLKFEGKYLNGKKWNVKGYNPNGM